MKRWRWAEKTSKERNTHGTHPAHMRKPKLLFLTRSWEAPFYSPHDYFDYHDIVNLWSFLYNLKAGHFNRLDCP